MSSGCPVAAALSCQRSRPTAAASRRPAFGSRAGSDISRSNMIDRSDLPDSARSSAGDQGTKGGTKAGRRRSSTSHAVGIALAAVTVAVVVVVIAGGVLAWRLTTGPIQLGFLT